MEVMEQWEEEVVEVALQGRRPRHQNKGRLEESVYFDNDRGTETITVAFSGIKNATVECSPSELNSRDQCLDAKLKNLDIGEILSAVINNQGENLKGESSHEEEDAHFKHLGKGAREDEESEEELIELEFVRAIEKLDTHTMYCPNCNSCITKVILRRRKQVSAKLPHPKPVDLLGCLSCFKIFIPTGSDFNPLRILGYGRENKNTQVSQQLDTVQGVVLPGHHIINVGEEPGENPMKGAALPTKPEDKIEEIKNVEAKKPEGDGATSLEAQQVKPVKPIPLVNERKGFDILKSIVYGGLVESIASLSVVSSAAAADATTLNIVALGLANLIGGIFIIGHNLLELKNDHPKGTSNERNVEADRYQELLGQRGNFLLHATVAVLSFLVFGLIPPVTYGFSFRKSDNGDLKLVAVAAASLLCIAILAFGKAHIQRPPRFYMRFKTVLYYVTNAILVSGVSYAVGDLIKRLMEKLGWVESSVDVTLSLLEMRSVNPAWGSY